MRAFMRSTHASIQRRKGGAATRAALLRTSQDGRHEQHGALSCMRNANGAAIASRVGARFAQHCIASGIQPLQPALPLPTAVAHPASAVLFASAVLERLAAIVHGKDVGGGGKCAARQGAGRGERSGGGCGLSRGGHQRRSPYPDDILG